MAHLEKELGVPLLRRTTRSVRLTEEGSAFLWRSRRILADLHAAEQALKGARSEPQGTLALTAAVAFGRIHIVPIVSQLLRNHARLSVRLQLIDRPIQLVEEGIDVAVRIGEPADSALRAIKVAEVSQVLVASPEYLKIRGIPTNTHDLAAHELILFTALSASDEWRFGVDASKVVRVQARLRVNTADAAIAAAETGLGISRVMSYQATAAIKGGRLTEILEGERPPAVPVNLLFQAARSDAPSVRSFITAAKEYFHVTDV
jgi:DNA-binding transcriptional LysR family regulator